MVNDVALRASSSESADGVQRIDSPTSLRDPAKKVDDAGGRFRALDGLRGVAAMAVVLFHFYHSTMRAGLESVLPGIVRQVMSHGFLGVQVFFVISGFVIAHSTWGHPVTAAYAARFTLRRQVRLDPLYWVVVGLVVLDFALPHWRHPGQSGMAPIPTAGHVLSHVVYAQEILYGRSITPVFWTLCIEVQFYLVFIAALYGGQRLAGARLDLSGDLRRFFPCLALAAMSVAFLPYSEKGVANWFLRDWYMFALGVWACWVVRRGAPASPLVVLASLLGCVGVFLGRPEPAAAGVTAITLVMASRWPKVAFFLERRTLLRLGRISYSLYLVHYVVGGRVLNAGHALTGGTAPSALFWLACAIAASVAAACVLHVLVERPTLRLAGRLKVPQPKTVSSRLRRT